MTCPAWTTASFLTVTLLSVACSGPQRISHQRLPQIDRSAPRSLRVPSDPWAPSFDEVSPVTVEPPRVALHDGSIEYPFLTDVIRRFTLAIARQADGGSLGFLPIQSHDAQRARGATYVSRLGERLARHVAASFADTGHAGPILSPEAMDLLLVERNLAHASLDDVRAVARHADRLDVDTLVSGRVTRHDDALNPGRTVLYAELLAYDRRTGRVTADCRFELPSDSPRAEAAYADFFTTSARQPASVSGRGDEQGSLAAEIRVVTGQLARQLLERIDPAAIDGIVYIAPADIGSFVRDVHELRAWQRVFGNEVVRREELAERTGVKVDLTTGMTLGGVVFDDFQAVESHLIERHEQLVATAGAQLCRKLSRMLGERLQPLLQPHEVWINDLGFTKWSDTQLVEGEMATGGLTSSLHARRAMEAASIDLAIQPFLERWGDAYVVRVEAYDLEEYSLAASLSAEIAPEWSREVERELDLGADAPPTDPEPASAPLDDPTDLLDELGALAATERPID